MCGITGVCNLSGLGNQGNIEKMLKVIHHRGPNHTGIEENKYIKMGMKRLSILDIENGLQPMYSENKDLTLIYNGEIFNYLELREDLIKKGYYFKTTSDTEVVLKMYQAYGLDCFKYFNGMFAVAIWHDTEKKLVIARDRYGKKPLHYYLKDNTLYFGSEIKSILINREVPREIDKTSLDLLLSYNYVPYPHTIFKNVCKLGPGSILTFDNYGLKISQFYDLASVINSTEELNITKESQINEQLDILDELIDSAVKIRLRSDVPLGAFLSGGVDSTTIVNFMKKYTEVNTFSIGFSDKRFNELPYSNFAAEFLKTKHTFEIVNPNIIDSLPHTIWHTDQPHGDVSFIPYGRVSQIASKNISVVLTGDGADELFAGYEKYTSLDANNENWVRNYFEGNAIFDSNLKYQLYNDSMRKELNGFDAINPLKERLDKISGDNLRKILYSEVDMLLEGNNLEKPDRMTMAFSVEARSPFMDYRIVEHSFSIPSQLKLNNEKTKFILKKLLERYLPYDFVNRKKSMFTVPIGEWFKYELKDFMQDLLLEERTLDRGLFDATLIRSMINDHLHGNKNYTRQLRLLVVLELWFRMFIDDIFEISPKLEDIAKYEDIKLNAF